MISIENSVGSFKTFVEDLRQALSHWATQRIEARLEADVDRWLHRSSHQRRGHVGQAGDGTMRSLRDALC